VSDLRITVISYDSDKRGRNERFTVEWSQSRGTKPPRSGNLNDYADSIPVMARGDQLILVETWSDHVPAFEAGLDAFEIKTYSFTRPRFAPQILFDASNSLANNGWGNGDQAAPGRSLCQNNAENFQEAINNVLCRSDNLDGSLNTGGGS
jgi:hypothetical protein